MGGRVDMGADEVPPYMVGQPRGESGEVITQANYDAWVAAGRPMVWCCAYQPCGDANGDGYANPEDYITIFNFKGETALAHPREDVNHDGFVNPEDYLTISGHIGQGDGSACP